MWKRRESCCLLQFLVPVDLDVGPLPEAVEVGPLFGLKLLPTALVGAGESRRDLILEGVRGASSRPPVGDVLDEPQRRSGCDVGGERHAREIVVALGADVHALGRIDDVLHCGGHRQPARAGRVDQQRS